MPVADAEATVCCPYCGDEVSRLGLRAHVVMSQDEPHGGAYSIPEDFRPTV